LQSEKFHLKVKAEDTQLRVELRVFSAAGVRESGAGVRIIRRRMHVRFHALDCPPARGKSLRIAQLYAAASHMGFRAMAKAAAFGNFPEQCWCVREQSERTADERNSQKACPPEGSPRDSFAKERTHRSYFVESGEKNR